MPAKALKAAEKHTIYKKLVTEMKRRYGGAVPKQQRSTFETLLFAACLEDSAQADAEAAYARLLESFFDLNEIRVSSVREIELALGEIDAADWKAMRIREALQYVFEKHYAFDLEPLRRKTQDVVAKELAQVPHQTPFIRNYVVRHALDGHVVPVDESILSLLMWLGLADGEATAESAAEDLKSALKKDESPLFCHLLKCVSTDPQLRPAFARVKSAEAVDPHAAPERLAGLFKNPSAGRRKAAQAAQKSVSKKKPVQKSTARSQQKSKAPAAGKKVTKKRPAKKAAGRRK